MSEYSNADDVIEKLNQIIDGFDFTLTVLGKSLGRDCAEAFGTTIAARATVGEGSEGQWAANSDNPEGRGYATYKERVYGVAEQPNIRTGQMMSEAALSHAKIHPDLVELSYGYGEPPRDGVAGRAVKDADLKITDREKARYAHEGQGPHRTKRPFYKFDDEICTAIKERVQDELTKYAQKKWGK